jgi:hypothetical protein
MRAIAAIAAFHGTSAQSANPAIGLSVGHTGAVAGGPAALLIHVESGTVLALTTDLGYATAVSPPAPKPGTPDPPKLFLPFHQALTSASTSGSPVITRSSRSSDSAYAAA